jgi:hypothetical protein
MIRPNGPTSSYLNSSRLGRVHPAVLFAVSPNPSQRLNLFVLRLSSKDHKREEVLTPFGRDVETDFRLSTTNQQVRSVPTYSKMGLCPDLRIGRMSNALRNKVELLASVHNRPVLEVQELFNERAAIRQHDGGLTRADAESAALQDVERMLTEWSCK